MKNAWHLRSSRTRLRLSKTGAELRLRRGKRRPGEGRTEISARTALNGESFPSSRMPCRPAIGGPYRRMEWLSRAGDGRLPMHQVTRDPWNPPTSSATARNRPMRSCRESTPLLRFSSGGCSAPTRAAFSTGISTTTSTNSPSGSIDGAHEPGGCSSTDSPNRLSLSDRSPTASSSELPIPIARLRNWSEGDTQLQLKHMGVRIQPA